MSKSWISSLLKTGEKSFINRCSDTTFYLILILHSCYNINSILIILYDFGNNPFMYKYNSTRLWRLRLLWNLVYNLMYSEVKSSWNVMAHGDAQKGKWRGNWRMEWVTSTLHTTSERGVSSITTANAHTSAASSRLNWRPPRFNWTRPFRRKTKSGFCVCAIIFQLSCTVPIQFPKKYAVLRIQPFPRLEKTITLLVQAGI